MKKNKSQKSYVSLNAAGIPNDFHLRNDIWWNEFREEEKVGK